MEKARSGIMLTLLLIGILTLAFTQPVETSETIYIRADDSTDPPTASIRPDTGFHAFDSVDWWPMSGHEPRHSGYSTSETPTENTTAWSYSTGDLVQSSPAIVDGRLYIGSNDWHVYCLNATNGAKIWSYKTNSWVGSSPAVADGMVFIGSNDMNIYCLNATTGTKIWSREIDRRKWWWPAIIADDGMVFVQSGYHVVNALNETNGDVIWTYNAGGGAYDWEFTSLAVADGTVFVGSLIGKFYALDEYNGSVKWSISPGSGFTDSAYPAVVDGIVYIMSGTFVYALNETNGSVKWNYDIHSVAQQCGFAVAYGVVFIGSAHIDPRFYAFNSTTGTVIWNYTMDSTISSSPAVADGMVFIGSEGRFYAFNATNGELIWSHASGRRGASPAIADGKVYVGSENLVYAFGPFHDVVVADVLPSKTIVELGSIVHINITVENQGDYTETFNVTAYYDDSVIEEREVTLSSMNSTILTFTWNITNVDKDHYTISARTDVIPEEINTTNNIYVDGIIKIKYPHDIAITNITPSKTAVGQGYSVFINVTIENQGDYTETFNVTAYANTTEIETREITLTSGNSTTILTWNTTGWSKGIYTISAVADQVPDEIDPSDNTLTDAVVRVVKAGDFGTISGGYYDFDDLCDYQDLFLFRKAYVEAYHPLCDFDNDLDVDYLDLFQFRECYIKS